MDKSLLVTELDLKINEVNVKLNKSQRYVAKAPSYSQSTFQKYWKFIELKIVKTYLILAYHELHDNRTLSKIW